MDITLRMSDHALTARAAAAAGIVLLQNKNRTLPLLPQEDGGTRLPCDLFQFGNGFYPCGCHTPAFIPVQTYHPDRKSVV